MKNMPMGKAELMMLVVVLCICFMLLIALTVYLTKRHGTKVQKGLKKSRAEILGYYPPKKAGASLPIALVGFACGVAMAFKTLDK